MGRLKGCAVRLQHADDKLPELQLREDVRFRANDPLFQRIDWSKSLKSDPLALSILDQQPGFSFVHAVGPIPLVVADLRTKRSHEQVMGIGIFEYVA